MFRAIASSSWRIYARFAGTLASSSLAKPTFRGFLWNSSRCAILLGYLRPNETPRLYPSHLSFNSEFLQILFRTRVNYRRSKRNISNIRDVVEKQKKLKNIFYYFAKNRSSHVDHFGIKKKENKEKEQRVAHLRTRTGDGRCCDCRISPTCTR